MTMSLESGRAPQSREEREKDHATFARLAACMSARDLADLDDDPYFPHRIDSLVCWYLNTSVHRLADEHNLSVQGFSKYAGHTENVLRRRMKARGLLNREEEQAA